MISDVTFPIRTRFLLIPWLEEFTRRAEEDPERIAVASENSRLTYGELAARSDVLASRLITSGAPVDRYIGIALEPSPLHLIALLAVIKSGAAYIPLDPAYPAPRLASMIRSARLRTIIAAADFPAPAGVGIINPAENHPTRRAEALAAVPLPDLHGTSEIYAIFTSGSTGEPKAASVFHNGFSNLLSWYIGELGLSHTDAALVISSPSFDLTQKNFYAPLATGGRVIFGQSANYDIPRTLRLLRENRITLLNCTPSAFLPLLDAAAAEDFAPLASLRFVVLGGEPIPLPRVRTWLKHPSCQAEIVNSYGPTECTDICLFHRLGRENHGNFPFVPLGREIPGASVSIRGEDMTELPAGLTGELCIGGSGLGGGYLFDAEKTAARFTGGLYRTGDLARKLPGGIFEFRGRADDQIKINGFRVELGDIETALAAHPEITEAIVTFSDGALTAHTIGNPPAAGIRAHLASILPAYMIPAHFVSHDQFPITPNGKADRRKLSEISLPQPFPAEPPASTGNPLEAEILAIWADVLARPVADPRANFFEAGGNSIQLAVIHVRLQSLLGRDFPITDLFAFPTPRALAGHFSPTAGTSAPSPAERAKAARARFSKFRRPITP